MLGQSHGAAAPWLPQDLNPTAPKPSLYLRLGVQFQSCHVLAVRLPLPALEDGRVHPAGMEEAGCGGPSSHPTEPCWDLPALSSCWSCVGVPLCPPCPPTVEGRAIPGLSQLLQNQYKASCFREHLSSSWKPASQPPFPLQGASQKPPLWLQLEPVRPK